MKFEFLPEADEEFREASRYYESEAPGVGMAFIAEVHRVILMVISIPLPPPKYEALYAVKCSFIFLITCSIPLNPI